MALKGTLADMAIIDLIQFPHTGRKTGQLVISGDEGEARLSYQDGSLVHASLGEAAGMDALVRVVDWNEGDFEFLPDLEPEARTIELDLHRAVMQALKLHDELKLEEQNKDGEVGVNLEENDSMIAAELQKYLDANDFATHVCVLDPQGNLKAAAQKSGSPQEGIEELRSTLHSVVEAHPRDGLNRIILEDALGVIILVRLRSGSNLVAVANKDASLGAVSVSVGRLAVGLE